MRHLPRSALPWNATQLEQVAMGWDAGTAGSGAAIGLVKPDSDAVFFERAMSIPNQSCFLSRASVRHAHRPSQNRGTATTATQHFIA